MSTEKNLIPCKVWNNDRTIRKSVVVSSLADLASKGKVKLGIDASEKVTVTLESDGTQIEDDDYFRCLDPNTTFIILHQNEDWLQEGVKIVQDETDYVGKTALGSINSDEGGGGGDSLQQIVNTIRDNHAKIISLSNEEMEVLVQVEQQYLANVLRISSREAGRIQLNCQRYLDDRATAMDAISLLQTFDKSNKRQRTS